MRNRFLGPTHRAAGPFARENEKDISLRNLLPFPDMGLDHDPRLLRIQFQQAGARCDLPNYCRTFGVGAESTEQQNDDGDDDRAKREVAIRQRLRENDLAVPLGALRLTRSDAEQRGSGFFSYISAHADITEFSSISFSGSLLPEAISRNR